MFTNRKMHGHKLSADLSVNKDNFLSTDVYRGHKRLLARGVSDLESNKEISINVGKFGSNSRG